MIPATGAGSFLPCRGRTVCAMAGEITPRGSGDEQLPVRELRASHEDRDRVVELLRMAAGDGRLSADELDQRLEVALTARTYGELAALTKDLPAAPGAGTAALGADEPKELIRIDCHSSTTKRDGRWLVPQRMEVRVASGTVTLDFTEAVITQPSLLIDAEVHSGRLNLITRPGIVVDADDVAARSGYIKVPGARGRPRARHPAHPGVGRGQQRPPYGGAAETTEAPAADLLAVAAAPAEAAPCAPLPLISRAGFSGSRGWVLRRPPASAAAGWRAG